MNIKISKKSLYMVVTGFFAVVFFIYAYLFVYSKIKFLSTEIGSATRSIRVFNEKRKEFEIAKLNLENHGKNTKILESAFFSESTFVDLLDAFGSVGRKAGVKFEAKSANLPSEGNSAEISFELKGNFNSIAKFLILLDDIRYSGLVNKFSLFRENEESNVLRANIDYFVFNYK